MTAEDRAAHVEREAVDTVTCGHCGHTNLRLAALPQTGDAAAVAREALYAARDALYRGEGPDLAADSDIVYGEWLGNRADALTAGADQ